MISGIQQIGIGIPSVYDAFDWYRKAFGVNIPMFDEAAEANLMLPYTGGKPHKRHAILALNLQGGGGFEIWQYTSRIPVASKHVLNLGDYGINIAKIKSKDVAKAYEGFKAKGIYNMSDLQKDPAGNYHFFVKDPYGNTFQVAHASDVFSKTKALTGGTYGTFMGVSDIDKSLKLYKDILGYDQVVYDETGNFEDLHWMEGGNAKFRRVLLTHSKKRQGPFSKLLGSSQIELVQKLDGDKPRNIYEGRFWGDLGFIHLCFDIVGMKEHREKCEKAGFPFTVDSSESFDMGEAAGHFTYIEDPDGAWIEFVETHKIPILKKIGWYLDLRKRPAHKAIPSWMLRTLSFGAVKD